MEQEITVLKQLIEKHSITVLLVDSYQATSFYLESLNQSVKVIYMDDMAKETYQISGVIH